MAAHPTVDPERVADALIWLADLFRQRHPEVVALRESEAHQRACPTCSVGGPDGMCIEGRQRAEKAEQLAADAQATTSAQAAAAGLLGTGAG